MQRLSLRADAGVGTVAVSPTSRDVVLAGRSGLYIVDLHDPFALPRWLPLRSAWEVASVQWCPHPQREACLVSSSNQKALVWNLALPSDRAVEHVLHGHRRAVTDIDFSPHHTEQLATASIDTTIRLWDLRQVGVPTISFYDFHAGAIQTRWSSLNENQIASAHDNRFVLWDKRRANLPVVSIDAHQGECNGLQFLANGRLMTCSTDRTVKLWDLRKLSDDEPKRESINEPELIVEAGFPVWRALPTPFELGALVVPLRGGDNNVTLINFARQTGHKTLEEVTVSETQLRHPDTVSDAIFMRSDDSSSHYDIVTWCQDSHLRQWDGGLLKELPHASSSAGCKDDLPPALPTDQPTFNTNNFDNISTSAFSMQDVFDLPILNRGKKDEAHAIGQLDWIAGVRLDQKGRSTNEGGYAAAGAAGEGKRTKKDTMANKRSLMACSDQLSQEIIAISSKFPRVSFDDINIGSGRCDFSLNGPWGEDNSIIKVFMTSKIPPEYPYEPITFSVIENPDLRVGASEEISTTLNETSTELSRHGVHALEFTVRYLVGDPVSIEDTLAAEGSLLAELQGIAAAADPVDSRDLSDITPTTANLTPQTSSRAARIVPRTDSAAPTQEDQLDTGDYITFENSGDEDIDNESFKGDELVVVGDTNDGVSSEQETSSETSGSSSTSDSGSDDGIDSPFNAKSAERRTTFREAKRDGIIDSTPVPKNCGAVWSPTGNLICFFNRKPVGKDKGPLPLDKVFADDSRSDDSNAPFLSDSEDFEQEMSRAMMQTTTNWSVTAAQLTANPIISSCPTAGGGGTAAGGGGGGGGGGGSGQPGAGAGAGSDIMMPPLPGSSVANFVGRNRSRTITSLTSEERSATARQSVAQPTSTHTVVVKNMLHLWPCRPDIAAEYVVDMAGEPLEITAHNAKVAAKHGLWEDESIWRTIYAYILVEEAQSRDPYAILTTKETKFDWCGSSTGLRSFLPHIATYLEKQGKIQLLACISLVFSALRGRRAYLRRMTKLQQPIIKPLAIVEPGTEFFFQAKLDGTVFQLTDRSNGNKPLQINHHHHMGSTNGNNNGEVQHPFPPEHMGMLTNQPDSAWFDPDMPSTVGTAGPEVMLADPHTLTGRRQSMQVSQLSPHEAPNLHWAHSAAHEGVTFGLEIDSEVVDFDDPPSSYIVLPNESNANEDFNAWLPRLMAYRNIYASLLQTWGLNVKRAEVVKLNPFDSLIVKNQALIIARSQIEESMNIEVFKNANCALCNSPITRLFEYCEQCSHIMHRECAQEWWEHERECPCACGCDCKHHVS